MINLISGLPSIWHDISEMQAMQNSASAELDILVNDINGFSAQCFVSTATWGLKLWEKELGILSNESLSYAYRRNILLARLQGTATVTVTMVRNLAEAFSGGTVVVIEVNSEYRIEICFTGTDGIPADIIGLIDALKECLPAHLAFAFRYSNLTWGYLKDNNISWKDFKNSLWNGG